MLYNISHEIRYIYSSPVFVEPHIFLLRPRCDASQQIRKFSMAIDPEPVGRHDFLDPEGNCATCLWFEDQINALTVSTTFDVQTLCANPFSYLVTDDAFFQLPIVYGEEDAAALAPFFENDAADDPVSSFARDVMEMTGGKTIDFLSRLCTTIYENYSVEIRLEGQPHPPAVTMQNKRGACRDLALLFVAVCRSMGLASRFVSGYQEGVENMEHTHLHAWAEVYIPGGGWRGYDPTHGLVVADRHIALAASHSPAGAAPVKGTFRGTGVTAKMDYHISISLLPELYND